MFDIDEVKITDKMGVILKEIRMEKGFSRELIAERAGIGTRHLAAIENEKRAPSIEVFCRIIRALGISSDCVVYPEYKNSESEEMQLIRLIRACDERDRMAIKAMIEALLYSREKGIYADGTEGKAVPV